MKPILCIAILIASCNSIACSQTIDTLKIIKQINALRGGDATQKALHDIIEEDQQFRGNQTNDSLDLLHLIWLSYFVKKFGYPNKKAFGNDAFATSAIWIHNHRRLRIIAFPIILKGFLSGQIKENDLREYYLRTIYTYRFEDDGYLTLPLKQLFEKLELNTSDVIPMEELLKVAHELADFKHQTKQTIGIWISERAPKSYDYQGGKVKVEFEDERIALFKLQNDQIFLGLSSSYGSQEPQELYLVEENKFKFKYLETPTYYLIDKGELCLMNNGKVMKKYRKAD